MAAEKPQITYLNEESVPDGSPAASRRPRHHRGGAFVLFMLVMSFIMGIIGAFAGVTLLADNQSLLKELGIENFGVSTESKRFTLEESSVVIDAAEKVSPSVVSITTSRNVLDFFGRVVEQGGAGTGFIVTNDGYVVTNKHVAGDTNTTYTVFLNDGRDFEAKLIATDPVQDLAVLKVDATGLKAIELGDSDALKVGQFVIAVGNALGQFQNTVTTGVVSAKERAITAAGGGGLQESLENLLQTDAAINPGNSGGPLVNLAGQVVGINTAVAGGAQNIGFAIPINSVKKAIESAQATGEIKRPALGVRFVPITKELAELNELPVDHGALIVRGDTPAALAVIPGSPADKAGIEENDIILEVNGDKVDERHSLVGLIQRYGIGDTVTLKVSHDGEEKTIELKLDELKR